MSENTIANNQRTKAAAAVPTERDQGAALGNATATATSGSAKLISTRPQLNKRKHSSSHGPGDKEDSAEIVAAEPKNDDLKQQLEQLWSALYQNRGNGNADNDQDFDSRLESAMDQTLEMITNQFKDFVQYGLDAFRRLETVTRECSVQQEAIRAKQDEIDRLRQSEAKQRALAKKLILNVDQAKSQAYDHSQTAVLEASLREKIGALTKEKNEALRDKHEMISKSKMQEERIRNLSSKLDKLAQEKVKMERSQRAAHSFAKRTHALNKSSDMRSSETVDYYKRKNNELTGTVEGLQSVLAAKDKKLKELQKQIDQQSNMGQKLHD